MTLIQQNLLAFKNKIHECEKKYGREKNSVSLLAVSKKQSLQKIFEAYEAGQHSFGENYLQEALPKIEACRDKNIEWHFIGPAQSNKTKKIAENFHWMHCISDSHIAERLNEQRPLTLPPLNVCIQINVSGEKTKSGIHADEAFALATICSALPRLKLRGLMTITAMTQNIDEQRREFHLLKEVQEILQNKGFLLDTLSMGMTDDWEAAIAEGSTLLRIGRAIFGERE